MDQEKTSHPRLLKKREAASLLSCSLPVLNQLINSGQIETVTVGRTNRIARDEIERFIRDGGKR